MANFSEVEERFNYAVQVIQSLPRNSNFQPSHEMMLRFYSLFKQANNGPCTGPRPGFWDLQRRAMYDAWYGLGDMSREEAMEAYVDELKKIVEVMPQTDAVGNFTRSLGRFYEIYVDKENAAVETANKSNNRTPSPVQISPNANLTTPKVGNGHVPVGENDESVSEDEDGSSSSDEDQFADTVDTQPPLLMVSDDLPDVNVDNNAILSAIERLQVDISSLALRLSNIERAVGELLVNSRQEPQSKIIAKSNSVFTMLRSFQIPRRIRTLVLFLLPIIAGYLLTRRFFFIRRR